VELAKPCPCIGKCISHNAQMRQLQQVVNKSIALACASDALRVETALLQQPRHPIWLIVGGGMGLPLAICQYRTSKKLARSSLARYLDAPCARVVIPIWKGCLPHALASATHPTPITAWGPCRMLVMHADHQALPIFRLWPMTRRAVACNAAAQQAYCSAPCKPQ
jgi:hypothetical protein